MAKDANLTGQEVIDMCSAYMNEADVALVQKALDYAVECHNGQFRKSGEPILFILFRLQGF